MGRKQDTTVIKVAVPKPWAQKLYEIASKRGYMSVSEMIRDMIRDYLGAELLKGDEQ